MEVELPKDKKTTTDRRLSAKTSTANFLMEWDLYLPTLHRGQDAVWFVL